MAERKRVNEEQIKRLYEENQAYDTEVTSIRTELEGIETQLKELHVKHGQTIAAAGSNSIYNTLAVCFDQIDESEIEVQGNEELKAALHIVKAHTLKYDVEAGKKQEGAASSEIDIDEEISEFEATRDNFVNITGQILNYEVEPEGEEEPAKKLRLTNIAELKHKLREVQPTISKGRPRKKGLTKDAA